MKKILTVNCTSDNGSISKIISDIEKENPGFEYFHCYQIGEKSTDIHEYLVDSWNMTRIYYGLSRVAGIKYGLGRRPTSRLIRHIKKVNPDLVHIHCPNFYSISIYKLFHYLKECGIPVLITNHAEFFYTGNCVYSFECMGFTSGCHHCNRQFDAVHPYMINRTHYEWKKMREAFQGTANFMMTVVSPWQAQRIRLSPIIPENMPVRVILNGVDTDVFHLLGQEKGRLREKLGIKEKAKDKFVAVQVSSFFTDEPENIKGGIFLIEMARMLPDIEFVVVGNYRLSEGIHLPSNLTLVGNISDQDALAMYYNAADVTVLTSRRETFGMACAESLCCGTPVAAFKAGGTESIALEKYSEFTDFGNVEALADILRKHRERKLKNFDDDSKAAHDGRVGDGMSGYRSQMCSDAIVAYDRRKMGREYGNIYESLLN